MALEQWTSIKSSLREIEEDMTEITREYVDELKKKHFR